MEKRLTKGLLMTALITGSVLWGSAGAFAEELDEYSLDQVIVTATRTEKKDLETPAIVEVYDAERIEKSNAGNAYDVLQNTLGVNTQSQGFNGTSMGTMTSKVMIRGVEQGTLVLVNGVPMNMDGKYNLDDIPTESIEKIEVVKGGGSVLYGSEATGGVINIITKKKMANKVKVAAGNYGKERYAVSVGADKFNIVAGYENRGYAGRMSAVVGTPTTRSSVYDYGKGERTSVLWNWEMTDGLTFTHSYSKNKNQYWQRKYNKKANDILRSQNNYYEDTDNMFLLQYDKDGWKANLSYGTQEKSQDQAAVTNDKVGARALYTDRKGHNTNIDIQKSFAIGKNKLLVGTSFQREDMDAFSASKSLNSTYERNNYSVYASYDWQLTDKSNLVFNARETWATACEGKQTNFKTGVTERVSNDNLSKFTPEVQYILQLTENSSIYAKAGKSFRLPNLTQIYGSGAINPALNLKPEQGTHYELGYKANIGKADWRVALFNYKIKDSIEADVSDDRQTIDYFNEDVQNTGVELSCAFTHDDNWSSHWGVTYQNPQAQNAHNYGDGNWHSIYNRYQLQGGVDYKYSKFTGSMSVNFVGNRTSKLASTGTARHLKPQCFTDLHFTYAAEKNQKAFLHINNIFDRLDITTNGSTNYFNLGRNFMVGYEYSF